MRRVMFFVFWCLTGILAILPASAMEGAGGEDDASSVTNAAVSVDKSFKLMVDGREVTSPDVGPVVKNGEVFVPIRFVTEELGASVTWVETDQEVRIQRGLDAIRIRVGEKRARAGKDVLTLKAAPFIHRKRFMVPLVMTASTLGVKTSSGKNSLSLTTKSAVGNESADKVIQVLAICLWMAALGVLGLRLMGDQSFWGKLEKGDLAALAFCLFVVAPLVAVYAQSHFWAAMVPAGAALAGALSRETFHNRLATMAASSMGLGILGTMLGLGFIIGPAVASHDVSAIGFGISVKIEASITGLGLSWIFNTVWGFISRE